MSGEVSVYEAGAGAAPAPGAAAAGCSVLGCDRSEIKPLLFPFPKEEKLRCRWAGATGCRRGSVRGGGVPGGRVCSRHFAPEQYRGEGQLRDDAVPALHLPPRGLEAEEAALRGAYSASTLHRLALHTTHRPVLLLQPPPPPAHPAHEAHAAALADLAGELRLRPDLAQARLDDFINVIYERLLQWCRLRAKYELGSEERAVELAPEWLRRAEEMRAGGPGGRGSAAALWGELVTRAKTLRTLDLPPPPGQPELGAVWSRGVELARARLELLTRVGDDDGALHPGARPTFEMEDLVLLLSPEDEAEAETEAAAETTAPGLALTLLFGLVQKYRLEDGERAPRARRWALAAREYRSRHRAASVLLLQRRWHRLKLRALRSPSRPPLHAALLRRFPHLYTTPPLPWAALVAADDVVERETPCSPSTADSEPPEDVAMRFQEPRGDDDVILVEKHIDTYEISDEEGVDEGEEGEEGTSDSTLADDVPDDDVTAAARDDGGGRIDVKLTLSPVVVVRDVAATPGWAVRGGRYVDVRRLMLPPPPPPAPAPPRPSPPRRSIANTIVFEEEEEEEEEDEDEDEPKLTISLPEDAGREGTSERRGGGRGREPGGQQATETVLRKKVQLPDIEQVRKQNRTMLTAEVLPCPAGTAGTGGAPLTPTTPVRSAPRNRSGSGSGAGAGRYCCWALRARAMNAARARHAQTAGRVYRPIYTAIDLHRSHCEAPCACCCAGAERGAAGAALAAEQRALDERLLRLMPAPAAPRPPAPPLTAGTLPAVAPRPPKPCGKKRRATSPPPPPPPPPDDLQEWIRQKNLTARFFDLNLKRPAPAPGVVGPIFKHSNTMLFGKLQRRQPPPPPPAPAVTPASAALPPTPLPDAIDESAPGTLPPAIKVISAPATEPPAPPCAVKVVSAPATRPTMAPIRVVSMPARVGLGPRRRAPPPSPSPSPPPPPPAPALDMMSVSEDEEAEAEGEGETRARARPDRGDTPHGMKIVAIRRNTTTGQHMIVIQPAASGSGSGSPQAAVKAVGRKATRRAGGRPARRGDRRTASPRDAGTASHSTAGQNNHNDKTDRRGYRSIIVPTALQPDGDGMAPVGTQPESGRGTATAAPLSMNAAPLTVTAAPMTATETPVSATPAGEERDRATGVSPQAAGVVQFQAFPSAFEDFMFKDTEVGPGQVSWAGRPLVMSCRRLQAPWAPLLGWYILTEEAMPRAEAGAGGVEYWVFGETMYRLKSLPPAAIARDLRLVHGVPDARSCRALAVRGAPLLALHVASRRVLRVAARRHGGHVLLRAAASHLAERLAEALNASERAVHDASTDDI